MKSFCERAQVTLEYLYLVIVMLLITGATIAYALTLYTGSVSNSEMKRTMENIKEGVNYINSLGAGSSLIVEIDLPYGVAGGRAGGKRVDYNAQILGSMSTYSLFVDNNITPVSLPVAAGGHRIKVSIVDGNITLQEI